MFMAQHREVISFPYSSIQFIFLFTSLRNATKAWLNSAMPLTVVQSRIQILEISTVSENRFKNEPGKRGLVDVNSGSMSS